MLEKEIISCGGIIIAKDVKRLTNTSCIVMPKIRGETQLIHFDINNIEVSVGSACSSGNVAKSHVLTAMNIPEDHITV